MSASSPDQGTAKKLLVTRLVVLLQQVGAEVSGEVAPDGVYVVVVVLRVVVLNQELRRLYAVVVSFTAFQAARPSEEDILPRLVYLLLTRLGDLLRHIVGVLIQQRCQFGQLRGRQFVSRDSRSLSFEGGLPAVGSENLAGRLGIHDRGFLLFGGEPGNQVAAQVFLRG